MTSIKSHWERCGFDEVATIPLEDQIFYLSFADPNRSVGEQWLGGCYVSAPDSMFAPWVARQQGCNPGGEARIVGPITHRKIDPLFMNRLLNREEIELALVPEGKS